MDKGSRIRGKKVPKIDFHVHYLPASYKEALARKYGQQLPDGFPTPEWNPTTHLQMMKHLGITTSIISISSPHVNLGDEDSTQILARNANEVGAELTQKYPGKFGLLATLPLPNVVESVEEIHYSWDTLHADGFTLPTNTQGVYLGDPRLDPIFEELNARKAVVVLHPNKPSVVPPNVVENLPVPFMEFFFDTTRAVTNMLLKGTFRRFPGVKFIIPHAGAFLPILADRLALGLRMDPAFNIDVYAELRGLYYDLAGACVPRQLAALLQLTETSHLFYGSDYPYTPEYGCIALAGLLDKTDLLTNAERQAVYYDNALRLIPRLQDIQKSFNE